MPKVSTDPKKITELLSRGVDEVIVRTDLKKKLASGKQLRVKLGIDPTSPHLHLGRSIPLLKLRDFQELGHKVVFIVGDFTGIIGDTSDKDAERPMLNAQVVKNNLRSYAQQAGKIIDIDKAEVRYNSEWLGKLTYGDVGEHANVFSLAEFIARENIARRLKTGKRVSLREVLYPLMQGYDSVAVKADVELGGTDQRFNLLAGRSLQQHYGQDPQNIVLNPLVAGLDGRKMSSSWGNVIAMGDEPHDMYGKVMSARDELLLPYFTFLTRLPLSEVKTISKALKSGANPRDIKMRLAHELVTMYHGASAAAAAQEHFVQTFQKKEAVNVPEVSVAHARLPLADLLLALNLVVSKSDARRVVQEGGVKVNGSVERDPSAVISVPRDGVLIQKGKRTSARAIFKK